MTDTTLSSGMNNLTTLIKRLEAATSRLEDIASSAALDHPDELLTKAAAGGVPAHPSASASELAGLDKDHPAAPPTPDSSLPPAIVAIDAERKFADDLLAASQGLDSTIVQQVAGVARAFGAVRQYLLISTKAKKPDMTTPAFSELISNLQSEMATVNDIRENNRGSPFKDQLAMLSEGMGALQWIVVDGNPADYVLEVLGGVQLFGNRVLKEYKDKDQAQVELVQAYYALFKSVQAYIKQWYPKGVTWNSEGIELSEALNEASSTAAPSAPPAPAAGGPPPPPPLPTFDNAAPLPPPPPAARSGAASGGDMGAIFDQLNRGGAVTAGLRKVDKSEMTHKNPALRGTAGLPEREDGSDGITRSRSRGPDTKPKPDSMRAKGGPVPKKEGKKELDGNKWIIENFEDPPAPLEIEVSLSQSVLISRCKNTTIRLVGKANAVSIDNCARTNLIIDSLVSSVDVIKAPNFALQVLGALPTVLLDQVDGAQIYLSKLSLATELFTSKCTSVNVNLPPRGDDGDYTEAPLPEQIRSVIKDGRVVSEIVEHAG